MVAPSNNISWGRPSGRFAFGQLDAQQQALYENNQSLAFQKLMDYYAQGNPNFANTTLGRYMMQQQQSLQNRFITDQSTQANRIATEKGAWDTQEQQRQGAFEDTEKNNEAAYNQQVQQYQDALANYQLPNVDPGNVVHGAYDDTKAKLAQLMQNPYQRKQYVAGTFKSSEDPLVWTKYLENNQDNLPHGFDLLTPGMRGANPGAFQVRRNVW